MFRAGLISAGALLLVSCTSYWVKSSGESPAWDLDDCEYKADGVFPVRNEVVYQTNRKYERVKCRKKDKNCRDGYLNYSYTQLSHNIEDVNQDSRDDYIENCMLKRGWQQKVRYIWQE